jgi:protein SCO1/2
VTIDSRLGTIVALEGGGMKRIAIFLLLALPALTACGSRQAVPEPAAYAGMVRDPAPKVDANSLPDAEGGEAVRLRAAAGGLLLVYFGYTLCPDVCPTTMSDVRVALDGLTPSQRRRVRVAMVTVDPRRDTPAVLTHYVHAFFRRGLALRTTDERLLAAVARSFGAAYRVTKEKDGTIDVMHTAYVYAVDDTGHVRLQWAFGTPARSYRQDVRQLLQETAA